MVGLKKVLLAMLLTCCGAELGSAQTIRLECLVADPPLSCIDDLRGTPPLGTPGAIIEKQMSIETRIDRFNELKNPDFRLQEGLAY